MLNYLLARHMYVLGFMFNQDYSQVLLVLKNRPKWQAGKFNGIGGHVEPGETPEIAMSREFHEEVGHQTTPGSWRHLGSIGRERDFCCHILAQRLDVLDLVAMVPMLKTDEPVVVGFPGSLPPNVIPNLRWIIPMVIDSMTTSDPCYAANFALGKR